MILNIEQRRIVELEPTGHMLIKGVAGSGKTSVAVRRTQFLQGHYCPEKDDQILLVTFNRTLLKYIQYQFDNLDETDLLSEHDFLSHHVKVEMKTIDRLMFTFFINYQKRHNVSLKIASKQETTKALQQAILQINKKYGDIKLISLKNRSFLLDEILWIKACDIPDLATYEQIDRIGRSDGGKGSPQKLTKNSEVRRAIYELMVTYDQILYNDLLVDFRTMNKLALQESIEGDYPRYTHIIIDESQDLSKVQLKFLKLLYAEKAYSSIMFVADNTQSIYSHSWLGKGRPYTTIGYDMSGKARTLSKNYRTTTEISKAAYSLIENDEHIKGNVDFVEPALIDRHGHAPIYRYFINKEKQSQFIISEINKLKNDYKLGEICIIARNRWFLDDMMNMLAHENIPCEPLQINNPQFVADTVKLTTMHSIKGLEFRVIFLIHIDENVIPMQSHGMLRDETIDTEERKLLYVGMTRANELLYMSSVGRPSQFLKDINNDYLRLQKDSAIRPFRSPSIQDFKLTDQIIDLNAREELTRQWLIKELEKTYHYPLELMTLEYPVQQFSSRGYVDIAISINVNGKTMPYIFGEVKSFATGIEEGLDQLLSYMKTTGEVRYGVVTDGVEIKFIDHNGEEMYDLPPCQPQFLPDLNHTNTYYDLRNRETYDYITNVDDVEHVQILNSETKLMLDWNVDKKVPLVGHVAAGIPVTAIENFEETILLPKQLMIQHEQTYALRVTGDSMIDANIDKGDIVIVQKQETANNGDIVIALIDDEATLKELLLMGSDILLISRNKNYEPIQMDANDVNISGKVIGVLKS